MVLRKLFGYSQVQKNIQNLNYQSKDVLAAQMCIDVFNQQNPTLGAIGRYHSFLIEGRGADKMAAALQPLRIYQEELSKAEEKEMTIRAQAALELSKLCDLNSVEPLITGLKDKYPQVRNNAALALGKIGDNRAISALANIEQEDSDESVRNTAKQALEAIKKHVN